jgi:tetratricopeptide (TPR) repeat protein
MIKIIQYSLGVLLFFSLWACKVSEPTGANDDRSGGKDFVFNSYFLEANKDKQLGNYEQALENYTHALKVEPQNAILYYEIAGLVAVMGDLTTAIDYAKMSIKLDPENVYYHLLLARLYQANGMITASAEEYYSVIDLQPDKLEFYFEQSSLFMSVGNTKKAIKSLNKAEDYFGVQEYISFEKERIFNTTEQYDKAQKELENLIEAFPEESRYSAMLAEIYLAQGKIDKAGEVYNKMLKTPINNGNVHLSLADYYRMIEDYDNTFKHLELAFASYDVALDSKVEMLANMLTVIGSDVYLNEKVYRLLEILIDTYPNEPKALTIYSDYLVKDHKYSEAQHFFDQILALEKSKYILWEQAMYIDNQLNDYKHMLKISSEAIQLFPLQTMFYVFNTISALDQKEYQIVVQSAQKGISLAPDNKKIQIDLLTYQGEAYHKMNMHSESDSVFDKLLKLDPDNTYVLNNYAYYLALRTDKLERSLELAEHLFSLSPHNPNHIDTYAWVLYVNKNYKKALEIIKLAMDNSGNSNATIVAHYGDILFRNQEPDEAIKQWEKAISLGGNSSELENKILNGLPAE